MRHHTGESRYWCRFAFTAPHLAVWLVCACFFLASASCSAWSLYSPCGPFGRCSTCTYKRYQGSRDGTGLSREHSNPNSINFPQRIRAASLFGVELTITPLGSWLQAFTENSDPCCSTSVFQFPHLSAFAISIAKFPASRSEDSCDTNPSANFPVPEYGERTLHNSLSWAADNSLQATDASILTRAKRSSSASLMSCAASLCNCAVLASLVDVLSLRDEMVTCDSRSCLFSRMNVLPSKMTSPAIPTTTRIGPRAWSSNFLSAQTSNGAAFRSSHLVLKSASSFNCCRYSSTAPMVNTSADTTAAHWLAARLFQSPDTEDKDRQGAELAATVKIWLIVCALVLVPLAAFVSAVIEIIRSEAGGPPLRESIARVCLCNIDRNNWGCATSRAFREVAGRVAHPLNELRLRHHN